MAGAFSAHLIDSYNSEQFRSMGPFGQPAASPKISIHGPMSFNPVMHGATNSQASRFMSNDSYMELSQESANKIAQLQTKLNQKLGPEFLSSRPGPGGGPKLHYAEGWKVINIANEVFGFNGWSSNIASLTTDFIDYNEETRRFNVGVTAVIRVTLRDGVFHEDVGYGMLENSKSKAAAIDKCKKEAVTDGIKRTLRHFGNLLGLCLYDKAYLSEVTKIKVPSAKFDRSDLYRRPEFDDTKPNIASTSASASTSAIPMNSRPQPKPAPAPVKQDHVSRPAPQKPMSAVPSHLTPAGKPPLTTKTGLNTPITTPQHQHQSITSDPPRKVAFANAAPQPAPPILPTVSADDSFGFYSDDDAFMAAVDLTEGDLGRPINPEEGGDVFDDINAGEDDEMHLVSAEDVDHLSHAKHVPIANVSSTSKSHSNQHRESGSGLFSKIFAAQQEPQSPSTSRPRHPNLNENTNPNLNPSSIAPKPLSKRATTPSGGFHFPPHMQQPPQQQNPPTPTNISRPPQAGKFQMPPPPNSMKRKVDAIKSSPRRPGHGPGMGLSHPHTGRQPLRRLEVGEGGEVKRLRTG